MEGWSAIGGLTKGVQPPVAVTRRSLVPQDVQVPVIGLDFEKFILRPVPAIDNFFDFVLPLIQPEANRPLIRFAA